MGLLADYNPAVECYQDVTGLTPSGIGDPVANIPNSSGTVSAATQSSSSSRPTLVSSENNHNGWRFDGFDDGIASGNFAIDPNAGFLLVTSRAITNTGTALHRRNGSTGWAFQLPGGGTQVRFFAFESGTGSLRSCTGPSDANTILGLHVYAGVCDGTDLHLYIDGSQVGTIPCAGISGATATLGLGSYTSVERWAGDILRAQYFDSISTSEVVSRSNDLVAYYSSPPPSPGSMRPARRRTIRGGFRAFPGMRMF